LGCSGGGCGCSGSGDDPSDTGDPSDPPAPVGVVARFTKKVIFFEDAYTNMPGELLPWQSTVSKLVCSAYGGEHGGLVTIDLAGASHLVQDNGLPLPIIRRLEPNETFVVTNVYRAVVASGDENDIVVSASFVENDTDWVDIAQDRITAVRAEITPVDDREECEHRHVLGIREKVIIRTYPVTVLVEVLMDAGWEEYYSFGTKFYRCPQNATRGGLSFALGDCVYLPHVRVVEPDGIVCHSAQVQRFAIADGLAGGIGMLLDLAISPETVSFSGLALMEEPSLDGLRSGYFTNEIFDASHSHTVENGAGVWYNISPDNHFFDDCPRIEDDCPEPWFAGELNWAIPIAWGNRDSFRPDDKIANLPQDYRQVFRIDESGAVTIEKFGQWVRRAPNGTVAASFCTNGE
ncbi:MAG: hypothetical protein ACI4RD_09535, partial [Kiritimatiellia bacterium]